MSGRILAVDDAQSNLIAIHAIFDDAYAVVDAMSGFGALAILGRDVNFDVILLDVHMPVLEGFDTAAKIRALPGCDAIPIIFVTAIGDEAEYRQRAKAVGAAGYCVKPIDPDVLRERVEAAVRARQT